MHPLTLQMLASNAWRTLGLPANASQSDVDRAARRMRIFPDATNIPATEWDLPGLGQVQRNKADIEQAVARLQQPESRVLERLLWYHTPAVTKAGTSPEAIDSTCRSGADSADPAARHDAALSALHAAMWLDPGIRFEQRWIRANGAICALAASEEYVQFLLQAEEQGDFEKRAEPVEIEGAVRALPEMIAAMLAAKVDEAIDEGDFDACGRLLRVLGSTQNAGYQTRVRDRIEDALDRRCRHLHADVGRRLVCDRQRFSDFTAANRVICLETANFYNDQIAPLHAELDQLSLTDGDRIVRARTHASKALAKVALAWVWAADYVTADETYAAALQLAHGTSQENEIRVDRDENAGRAMRQRQNVMSGNRVLSYSSKAGWSNNSGLAKPASAPNGSRGWATAGIFLLFLIIRFATSMSNSSSSPSPPLYPPYVPPTYTFPNSPAYGPAYPPLPSDLYAPRPYSPHLRIDRPDAKPAVPEDHGRSDDNPTQPDRPHTETPPHR